MSTTEKERWVQRSTDGSTKVFSFGFEVFQQTDGGSTPSDNNEVKATLEESDGTITEYTAPGDFTISLNGDQNTSPGGTITFGTAPATGTLTIYGDIDYEQPFNQTSSQPVSHTELNQGLDRIARGLQQVRRMVRQAVRVPVYSALRDLAIPGSLVSKAGQFLQVNDDEDGFSLVEVIDASTLAVTSFLKTMLANDDSASAVRSRIGVVIGTDVASQSDADSKLPKDGSEAMTGDLPMGGNKITNAADGTADTDLATVGQLNAVGGLKSVQVFNSSGTWNRPSGVTKVLVEVIGAGGGGGGGNNTSSSNGGSGGGGGGYGRKILDVSGISSATITIGVGGNGGAAGSDGLGGGLTSWSDGTNTISDDGGGAGLAGTGSPVRGGIGSSGIFGADVSANGSDGGHGNAGYSGFGGMSGRGSGQHRGMVGINESGFASGSRGSGGSGGTGTGSGGDGRDGQIIVWEYGS